MMKIDYSLYLVTDRTVLNGRDLCQAVEDSLHGGVTLVQLREKDCSSREFYQLAKALKGLTEKYQVPLIINDRLDIALAVDAAGVHIGQEDLPLQVVRRLLGPNKIIGLSVSDCREAEDGEKNGADYLGAGPAYLTNTKVVSTAPLGPAGLRKIKAAVSIPVVGIGGINGGNVRELKQAGIDGVAVVSGILGSGDPEGAARIMLDAWRNR